MPPIFRIRKDEVLEFRVGDPPEQVLPTLDNPTPEQPPDDRTVFYYHRLRYSDRQGFYHLFTNRGRTDMDGYNMAVIATCLVGWKDYLESDGSPVAFPPFPETEGELTPQMNAYPFWLPGTALYEQRKQILEAVEDLLLTAGHELVQLMLNPSPEDMLKNWQRQSTGNGSSPVLTPATATPASIAAENALRAEKLSHVIAEV